MVLWKKKMDSGLRHILRFDDEILLKNFKLS